MSERAQVFVLAMGSEWGQEPSLATATREAEPVRSGPFRRAESGQG